MITLASTRFERERKYKLMITNPFDNEQEMKRLIGADGQRKARAILEILAIDNASIAYSKLILKVVENAMELRATTLSGAEKD